MLCNLNSTFYHIPCIYKLSKCLADPMRECLCVVCASIYLGTAVHYCWHSCEADKMCLTKVVILNHCSSGMPGGMCQMALPWWGESSKYPALKDGGNISDTVRMIQCPWASAPNTLCLSISWFESYQRICKSQFIFLVFLTEVKSSVWYKKGHTASSM